MQKVLLSLRERSKDFYLKIPADLSCQHHKAGAACARPVPIERPILRAISTCKSKTRPKDWEEEA